MTIPIDFHVHSTESIDGEHDISVMCRTAIELGLTAICFTEHVDFDPGDAGTGFFQLERYTREIARARDAHGHRLTILQGIEFSEPHRHPREFDACQAMGLDFLLASVHSSGNVWAGGARWLSKEILERVYESHFSETLRAVRHGGFDALAHIDLPRRYLGQAIEPAETIEEILREMIRQGIALEINTCPMRHGPPGFLPSDGILESYARLGGSLVTVGSDAHNRNQLARRFPQAAEKISAHRLKLVSFIQREPIEVPLPEEAPLLPG